jgi:GT2 family glycosyltransferase
MLPLTISIVTANNKKLIIDCLSSIYEKTIDLEFEVYVVINNSHDDSVEAIREKFPQVKLIKNKRMLGFTHNHNTVMRRGKGKYFLVLNDDTIILDGALKKMIDFMEISPDIGILGCRILNPDGSLQWSCGKSITHKIEHIRAGVLRYLIPFLSKKHFNQPVEVCWVTGACMLARGDAIQEVGVFDENIIIYYEDADWCHRMIQAGWKVVFYPYAEIIHYLGKTREKHLFRDLNIAYKSRYYFFRKHYSKLTLLLVKSLTVVELMVRYLRCLVIYIIKHEQRHMMKESLKSYRTIFWRTLGIQGQMRQ